MAVYCAGTRLRGALVSSEEAQRPLILKVDLEQYRLRALRVLLELAGPNHHQSQPLPPKINLP